jgi:predicted thioesterase
MGAAPTAARRLTTDIRCWLPLTRRSVGAEVVAEAVLTKVDGRRLTFTVSASDEHGLVAVGKMIRVVVDVDRFLSRCGCRA